MSENKLEAKIAKYVDADVQKDDQIVEWGVDHGVSNAIINHFKVKPKCRKKGVGSKVLSEIEYALSELGFSSIVIHMRGGKQTISFLESNDYKITNIENNGDYVTGEKTL